MTELHIQATTPISMGRLSTDNLAGILILGGTSEAAQIAARLARRPDLAITSSLAGRTGQPKVPIGRVRIGGFGGVDGLIAYLESEEIDIVIDATHPFASRISVNAEAACHAMGAQFISFCRPPWPMLSGDLWHEVPDVESAAAYVANKCARVFLAIGRQQVDAFASCTAANFLIRSIDPPTGPLPANARLILDRGPFDLEHEIKLLRDHAIDLIVSKNSGGPATYAKIEAARILKIPVVMVSRAKKHSGPAFATVDAVLAELDRLLEEGTR